MLGFLAYRSPINMTVYSLDFRGKKIINFIMQNQTVREEDLNANAIASDKEKIESSTGDYLLHITPILSYEPT